MKRGDAEIAAQQLRKAACNYAAVLLRSVPVREETRAIARLYEAAIGYGGVIGTKRRSK